MLFVFGGMPEVLAQAKVPKVKITGQPVSVVAELGQAVEFSVSYSSTTPVTFQWRLNGLPLSGEISSTLVIDQALPGVAGKYDVVITNGAGATASKAATLTVNLAPESLSVDDIIQGSFTLKVAGETFDSDGAFIVTGTTTLQDPEAPSDTYTFTYKRLPKNKATLVINGRFFDSELGGYITSVETHSLTFVGVIPDGRLLANDSLKGYLLPPIGYVQKKLNFTGTGGLAVETEDSADLAYDSVSRGTLTLGTTNGLSLSFGGSHSPSELHLNSDNTAPSISTGALSGNSNGITIGQGLIWGTPVTQ